ncbi:hypothetical protein JL722_13011 [Aureococcus anophagefferens]|nr:hypothetical protein JL722_13011 [Aureococcus anophagefferens]
METPAIVAHAVPPRVAAAVPPPLPHPEDGPAAGDDPAADAALAAAIERLARHGAGAGGPRIHATTLDLFDLFAAGERPAASQPPAPFLPGGRRREVSESSSDYYGVTRVANAAAGGPHAWQATVRLANEAPFYVGTFATAEAAALAYNDAVAYHGLAAARRTNEVRDDGTLATKPPRSSEFYGVYRQCSKWLAKLRNYTTYGGDGAVDYIGYWESEVDAAAADAPSPPHPTCTTGATSRRPVTSAARAAEAARPPRAPPEKRESRHYGAIRAAEGRDAVAAVASHAAAPAPRGERRAGGSSHKTWSRRSRAARRAPPQRAPAPPHRARMASRYQRQKAARESERRKAEAAHEALLASFSSSFAGDSAGFVRGGDHGGGENAVYKMAPPPAAHPPRAPAPALGAFFGRDGSPEPKKPPPKNRHIDAFLEELKGRQASGAPRRGRRRARTDGVWWVPPACRDAPRGFGADRADRRDPETFLTGRQAERARDRERGVRGHAKLKADDAAWFAGAVDALTTSRAKVGEAMAFCYDHVAAAEAVSAILKGALVAAEPTLALGKRVARLYLASDVLRNSLRVEERQAPDRKGRRGEERGDDDAKAKHDAPARKRSISGSGDDEA